jgi:mevalonate kinase
MEMEEAQTIINNELNDKIASMRNQAFNLDKEAAILNSRADKLTLAIESIAIAASKISAGDTFEKIE